MTEQFLPPRSLEIERAVLGACILSKEALGESIEIISPSDFSDSANRILYSVLTDMYIANKPVDVVTVGEELRSKRIFERLGGAAFLTEMVSAVVSTANVSYYAGIVREYSVRRRLVEAGNAIMNIARDFNKPIPDILEEAEKLIFDAGQNRNSTEFRHVRELIGPVFVSLEERYRDTGVRVSGYPTGFTDLDNFTGGLQPGSLSIIAARPSMGKTALALNIAQFGGGEANPPVLIFSVEMPASQLVQRMLSAESRVDLSKLARGMFDTSQFEQIRQACNVVANRNIFIDDTSQLTALDFLARCRRFKNRYPALSLVVVDYLQLMSAGAKRTEGRQQEVSDISRILKATAREINCPVVALSQLSRASEQRTDKKPQLSDLRDSGAIEQDADLVIMLYRADYYTENENNDLTDSKADIRIAKNRNGSTGVFHLTFKREITRFLNFGEE